MSFNRKDYNAIGKAAVNTELLKEYKGNGKGAEWLRNNWPPNEDSIGFCKLQGIIPDCSNAVDTFKDRFSYLLDDIAYFKNCNEKFDILYEDPEKRFYVIYGSHCYMLQTMFLTVEMFADYSDMTVSQIKSLSQKENIPALIPAENTDTVNSLKDCLEERKAELSAKADELKEAKEKMKAEIEEKKREIEAKYKEQFDLLYQMQEELEAKMAELKRDIYILDSEIYSIRLYNGEVMQYNRITEGKDVSVGTPVVIYQKVRYLDEELGKMAAMYGIDADDIKGFENFLKARADVRELFFPSDKCVVLFKVCKNTRGLFANQKFANMLELDEKYKGGMIGVGIKNGENIYIGWTEESRITLPDGNMFYTPGTRQVEEEDAVHESSTQEKVSRYFLASLLQGLIDSGKMLTIPEKDSILRPKRYIILSSADGWIEDNRFGKFADIIDRTNAQPLQKGDMILTLMHITRDDYYRSRIYDSYNNDRGRGSANRTHDASIEDCCICPVNCIDTYDYYKITYETQYYNLKEIKTPVPGQDNTFSVSYEFLDKDGEPKEGHDYIRIENGLLNDRIPVKGLTPTQILELDRRRNEFGVKKRQSYWNSPDKGYIETFKSIVYDHTDKKYFVSVEKTDHNWQYDLYRKTDRIARANFEIKQGEMLNLTYLNSVWVRYAIANRNIGSWMVGGQVVDYAYSIKYLNKALEYLDEREKQEAALLEKYMELYPDWQIDVCEWRMKKGYHSLTETRAKAFARERKKTE